MFESDDFDQILSQFDFPVATSTNGPVELKNKNKDLCTKPVESLDSIKQPNFSEKSSNISCELLNTSSTLVAPNQDPHPPNRLKDSNNSEKSLINPSDLVNTSSVLAAPNLGPLSPKPTKRKIIDSYFDHKSKRKFPGPAGLLNDSFKENNDEVVCQMELLSQDVDFTQNCLQKDAFHSSLWQRLQVDIKDWNLGSVDTTRAIKQSCISGNLRKRKAQTVAAFVESVDRSITDPLVTIRDCTGSIKCTLHRDAWSKFSPYIASEYCALVLWKPTILTTGSAFKKYYLNITLSNIFAIYSSAVLENDANVELPNGYIKTYEGDFTVIKMNEESVCAGANVTVYSMPEENGLIEGLDNFFSDDIF